MDMSKFAKYNGKVHYIAIFIDIFSHSLYAQPMKNKTTKVTLDAIKQVFRRSQLQLKTFQSDAGNEFAGKEVHECLTDREIYQQLTQNQMKGNYAERVIQTLKRKIYKYMYHNKTHQYIDVLQKLVNGYDNS